VPWYFSRRSFSSLKSSAWARAWRISRARSLYVSVKGYVALRVRTRNAFYLYLLQFELSWCADLMWMSGLGRTLVDLSVLFSSFCRPFVAPFAPLPKRDSATAGQQHLEGYYCSPIIPHLLEPSLCNLSTCPQNSHLLRPPFVSHSTFFCYSPYRLPTHFNYRLDTGIFETLKIWS
jgi:hypothetical protein